MTQRNGPAVDIELRRIGAQRLAQASGTGAKASFTS
jgi:hypothetical protein